MILRLTLVLAVGALLSSCAYPFGHSKRGDYYGRGTTYAPRNYLPKEVRREEPVIQFE